MKFATDVIAASHNKPIVVQFSLATCPPCKIVRPILEDLSSQRNDYTFVYIDCDTHQELARQFKVRGVPHVLLFREGQEVSKMPSSFRKDIITTWLDTNIYSAL